MNDYANEGFWRSEASVDFDELLRPNGSENLYKYWYRDGQGPHLRDSPVREPQIHRFGRFFHCPVTDLRSSEVKIWRMAEYRSCDFVRRLVVATAMAGGW